MVINTLKGTFFMKNLIPSILTFIVLSIPVLLIFWRFYKHLYKKYITSPDHKDDPKKLMNNILLCLFIYFIGFLCAANGASIAIDSGEVGVKASIFLTASGLIVTVGLALLIYTLQALESRSTVDIIENRIEKKLKEITKKDIKEIILQAALTQLDGKLDAKRIEDEIINRVSSSLIEKDNKK